MFTARKRIYEGSPFAERARRRKEAEESEEPGTSEATEDGGEVVDAVAPDADRIAQLRAAVDAARPDPLDSGIEPAVPSRAAVAEAVLSADDENGSEDAEERPKRDGRGRPKSPATVEREMRLVAALAEEQPRTKQQLAEALGEDERAVYTSLRSLQRAGRVSMHIAGADRYGWYLL